MKYDKVNKHGERFRVIEFHVNRRKENCYTLVEFESGHVVKFPYIDPYRYNKAIINPFMPSVNGYGYLAMTKSELRKLDKQYYRRWCSIISYHSATEIDEYFHSFANFFQWCNNNNIDLDKDFFIVIDKKITKSKQQVHGRQPIKVMRIVPYAKVGIPFDSINEYSRECGIKQSGSNLSTLDNIKINDNGDIIMRYEDGLNYLEKIGGRVLDESE